ncbi:hypothetical protein C0995_012842 [Termitomyces sp. Mi166|nr:hypothetical protein C0995_012842 [Termitomyces sp. Mi166\
MRATELFAIFAFIKSLERIYFTPGFMPSFVGSGVVSVSSVPPVLLKIIPYDFFCVEIPAALPPTVDPVDSPVSVATIVNAPTCIAYISQIARPRFSPVPIVPSRPQPICWNRHLHPKFEAPGPKSPRTIPSPFPPPSKPILPTRLFAFLQMSRIPRARMETRLKRRTRMKAFGSRYFLRSSPRSGTFLARRPIRSSASHLEPVDNQGINPLPWSQPSPAIPKRKKVEYRSRVTQPRVFISALPSLPAVSDVLIIIPQRPAEFNVTVSVPVQLRVSTSETSPPLPCRTATPVTEISPETVPPEVDQTEVTASSCALGSVPPSSTEPSSDETVVEPRSSPTPPTLPTAPLQPLVSEENHNGLESSCWAPTAESTSVVTSDVPETSSSLPACGSTIDSPATSLPTPTPTPAKKKRVRTKGPRHLRVPKPELPTVEIATTNRPDSGVQESGSQSTRTTETPSNTLSDLIWVPKTETLPENDVTPTARLTSVVQYSDEATIEVPSNPTSSLSDSIWAPEPSKVILEEDVAPIVTLLPSEEMVSGIQDSICATASDVPASSQLACESASEAPGSFLPTPTPTPAKKKRVRTKGPRHLRAPGNELPIVQFVSSKSSEVQDLGSSTAATTLETPSEPSSSLPPAAPESTENAVSSVTASSGGDKASGLQDSIETIAPEVAEVVALAASSTSASTSSNPSGSSSSQLASEHTAETSTSLPTPPLAKKKRVRTKGPKHLRIQSTQQTATPETTPLHIAEVSLPTTAAETPSESSSSSSDSIWALKPSGAIPEDVVTPLTGEKASGLQDSIWATAPDVIEVVMPPATLPTPPPSAKKTSGLGASMWADDTQAVPTSSAPATICEEDLLACERRNDSVSASRWANASDTPSTPRPFTGRGDPNKWRGRRRGSFRA